MGTTIQGPRSHTSVCTPEFCPEFRYTNFCSIWVQCTFYYREYVHSL